MTTSVTDPATSGTVETAPMIGMGSADHCPNCDAAMATDQRYCVECGNRRGKPRFSMNTAAAAAAPASAQPAGRRFSPDATLLLGLAILILALGTGVLIGNSGSSSNLAGKPYRFTINNGSGGGGTAAATGSPTTGSGSTGKSSKSSGSKTANLSGKIARNVNIHAFHTKAQKKAAVTKQLDQTTKLGNGKQIGSEKTTIGSPCTDNTVGCVNGKYTGSYF